jgi:guanosine-3',5'-bis(diphosphate) 3'-pyrophosphohydrolase
MNRSVLSSSLLKIKQHCELLQRMMEEHAPHNTTRVEKMYQQFQHCIEAIYKAGEGWIEKDVHAILTAVQFAAVKHSMQLRKDLAQTSYVIHPLSVTYHLMTVGQVRDPDIIIAGLLHDTLEDTMTSYKEIEELFGKRAADFVQEVTDDKALPKEERKRLQILHAPLKSAGAAQIKLADKWDNLVDLLEFPPIGWAEQRIQAYFEWAKDVIEALPWVNGSLFYAAQEVILKRMESENK